MSISSSLPLPTHPVSLPSQLAGILRVLKHRELFANTTDAELARLADLSRKTIIKYKAAIAAYVTIAPEPSQSELNQVSKRILQTYIDGAIASHQNSDRQIAAILGAIAGYVLRYEVHLIGNVNNRSKIVKVGAAFIGLSATILARKDNEGTPIHNQNKDAHYLLTGLNKVAFVDKLFKRSVGYQSGQYAKRWSLNPLANQVIDLSVNHLLDFLQQYQATHSQVTLLTNHIPPLVWLRESVTLHTSPPTREDYSVLIKLDDLQRLSLPSVLQLLHQADFCDYAGYVAVSLANLSSHDAAYGRTYNVFTSLKGHERKALGFMNYDISSAIQIICFGLLYRYGGDPDLFEHYSLIFSYGYDPDSKRELRNTISQDLGMPLDEVKALLTAYANGSSKHSEKHPLLKAFSDDSDLLRREVISVIAQNEPQVLAIAISQSRHVFDDDMDWTNTDRLDDDIERKKSSVFFFIWTYFEKQIRDAMLTLTPDGIPLHDAVYSRHQIPLADMEAVVKEKTGFEVKISH